MEIEEDMEKKIWLLQWALSNAMIKVERFSHPPMEERRGESFIGSKEAGEWRRLIIVPKHKINNVWDFPSSYVVKAGSLDSPSAVTLHGTEREEV